MINKQMKVEAAPATDTGIASYGELIEEIDRLRDCEQHEIQHSQGIIDKLLKDKAVLIAVLKVMLPGFEQYHRCETASAKARAAISQAERGAL